MTRRPRRTREARTLALLLLLVALVPARARAAGTTPYDDVRGPLPLWFTLQGGLMFPAGEEGSGLRRGPEGVGSIGYQVGETFHLAGELGLISSSDVFRTRVAWAGLSGRLNPHRDMHALYVQGGAAIYHTSYHEAALSAFAPPSKIRPGLSFGIGYDTAEWERITVGVIGMYHGIVIARGDALSYLTLGVYASLRPAFW
jgi:hypothetical protein